MQAAKSRKVTIRIDDALLRRALSCTKVGARATIERGLQLIATSGAYDRLRALRGKVKLSLDVKTLRAGRR